MKRYYTYLVSIFLLFVGNNAAVDVAARDKSKFIEYKWLTSATTGKDDFIREFIKRDLFNPDRADMSPAR